MNWLSQATRKRADKRDKIKARKSNGEYQVISNSGAGRKKLDLVGDLDAIETKFTDKTSFKLKADDLKKLFRDVKRTGNPGKYKWPAMEISMKDSDGKEFTVIVLQPAIYENLKEVYREKDHAGKE